MNKDFFIYKDAEVKYIVCMQIDKIVIDNIIKNSHNWKIQTQLNPNML